MINSGHDKPSILVVDDTPENIDVLIGALKVDYTIRPALDGVTALKIASSDPKPDLILLDIMMPKMDGYEVMRRLQMDDNTRQIPVIFVTAASDIESELKGFELGAVDYITKPFSSAIVRARVGTHLELHDARKKLEKQNQELKTKSELLEKIANLDSLTGISNRRHFDEALEIEWSRAMRNNAPLSIIVADIDYFKGFNDYYGHIEGDKCLCLVARCLSSLLQRPTDMVARYGGEEFVAILSGTDTKGAELLAENWRAGVEKLRIPHAASAVSDFVTISAGHATMVPGRDQVPYYLVGVADEMLYQSKEMGRNQISGRKIPPFV
jgi:diguanylate cyclase (GGDEF)-like protein